MLLSYYHIQIISLKFNLETIAELLEQKSIRYKYYSCLIKLRDRAVIDIFITSKKDLEIISIEMQNTLKEHAKIELIEEIQKDRYLKESIKLTKNISAAKDVYLYSRYVDELNNICLSNTKEDIDNARINSIISTKTYFNINNIEIVKMETAEQIKEEKIALSKMQKICIGGFALCMFINCALFAYFVIIKHVFH